MPTKAASWATAGSMRATSAASAASASGSSEDVMCLVEPCLQDNLCSLLVAHRAAGASTAARGCELVARNLARPALVDEIHRQDVALPDRGSEVPRPCGHRVRRTVGVRRQADAQPLGSPLADECRDCVEADFRCPRVDRHQRARRPCQRVADGDADPARAEIEGEHRRILAARGSGHACPTLSDSREMSTPMSRTAAVRGKGGLPYANATCYHSR